MWTMTQPQRAPSARTGASAANLGDQVVLFGGYDGARVLNETWTWDGAIWTQQFPQTSPAARVHATAATLNGQIVLFGGEDVTQDANYTFGDTWIWDGTNWAQLNVNGPPACTNGAMVAL
jgi:hypothetical protein